MAVAVLQDAPLILLGAFIVLWFGFHFVLYSFWKPFVKVSWKKRIRSLLHARFSNMAQSDEYDIGVDGVDDFYRGIRVYHIKRVRSLLVK